MRSILQLISYVEGSQKLLKDRLVNSYKYFLQHEIIFFSIWASPNLRKILVNIS